MKFFDYDLTLDIDNVDFTSIKCDHPYVVDCLNPHSFVTAEKDDEFKQSLIECDMLIPDGVGVCMEVHRWLGRQIKKIAGDDFHLQVLDQLNKKGGKVFYMGSTERVLAGIRDHIERDYPNIEVMTHSPSYCAKLSDTENADIIAKIEDFAPDALMVGLGAPKQEKWIHQNLPQLHTPKVIGAIGGAFEFFAGTIKRAPAWVVAHHLEWLFRFLKEPRRMWQRNVISAPAFLRYTKKHHSQMG